MKIDITRKYQTRDGQAVRLISDQGHIKYPIIGLIDPFPYSYCWTAEGLLNTGIENKWDLVPVKEKKTGWVNIYPQGVVSNTYESKKHADEGAQWERVACVQISWEE